MALFDDGSGSSLQDVLGQQADTLKMGINQNYARQKKRAVDMAASSGRLRSGVSNYTFGDINANQASDLAGVDSNLASALSAIPTNDYMGQQDYQRNLQLAELIGRLNRPNGLQAALGGAMSGGMAGAMTGNPWLALGGAAAGGVGGYYANQ